MRIGIDAKIFQNENKTGIPIAIENVLRVWNEKYPENEYYLFCARDIHLDFEPKDNWHVITSPIKAEKDPSGRKSIKYIASVLLYNFVISPIQKIKHRTDIFWYPNYFLPFKVGSKKHVITIHDLALFHMPQMVKLSRRLHHRIMLPWSAARADKIIAISRATADDIHRFFATRKDKIAISYEGGLHERSAEKHPYNDEMKPELNIKGRFILFISTIEPRKNIITLIKAFEKYLDRYKDDDLYLVLAGGRGWKCDNIYKAAQTSRYKDKIIMPGYITNDEKQYLFENAELFAYPSLYEGFGIPVLEAFDKGLPVITTNVSSLPEVGGDAAFYIENPKSAGELSEQIRKVLTLTKQEKAQVRSKMEKQLKKFCWEKNAQEIMRLFKRLAAKK